MADYRLTLRAEADFREIGRYTQQTWGRRQREAYLSDLVTAFQRLTDDNALGRPRDDVRAGLLSHLCGRHVIFFRRRGQQVEILRILHGRQSADRAFRTD